MIIDRLFRHTWTIPIIARWYFQEWGHVSAAITVQDIEDDLSGYTNRDALPQALVALHEDTVLGIAELKFREVSFLPQYAHWIGGLFVNPIHRGEGVGDDLVGRIIKMARDQYLIDTLYLQTERLDGGLYIKHGWHGIETITVNEHPRLIMANDLRKTDRTINSENEQ